LSAGIIVAKDTQQRHIRKQALMVNFDVMCAKKWLKLLEYNKQNLI
jgi:hypothetical protein